MMKHWLAVKEIMTDDTYKRIMAESGHTLIALNEADGVHKVSTILTDIDDLLVNTNKEDIGDVTMITLISNLGIMEELGECLTSIFEPTQAIIGKENFHSHIFQIDPNADPDYIDSFIWQRLLPWIPTDSKRHTLIFTNVIYGDESMKLSSQNGENIDVTSMGRTMQKIATKTLEMNGNAFVIYNQEVTVDDVGGTTICVI